MFFDGVCGLCNYSVNFLIQIDRKDNLLFAPLQGETAKRILEKELIEDLNSMVLYHKGKIYTKSTAVIKSIIQIGGFWTFFNLFLITPQFIRDWLYDLVASNRYNIFGKNESCRIPTSEERNKILD